MSITSLGWARNTAMRVMPLCITDLPVFLCPTILRPEHGSRKQPFPSQKSFRHRALLLQIRPLHLSVHSIPKEPHHDTIQKIKQLPLQCPGCGALSQTFDNQGPGFYSLGRRSVKAFLAGGIGPDAANRLSEEQIVKASLQNVEREVLKSLHFDSPAPHSQESTSVLCDRCHRLLHHHSGASIHHPSIESIRDTILESPHRYNHIYHVLDAADFPMSLIPGLHRLLHLTPQRSLNRRSKTGRFYHGRMTEVSFIIARSDLLAPLKTQVDSMMPYLVGVLRDALGSIGKDARLGNVRCVSAKRGWWTKELKEDIWNRGGGGWMVGKVNVGKSQLFESVFPKGRHGIFKLDQPLSAVVQAESRGAAVDAEWPTATDAQEFPRSFSELENTRISETGCHDASSLLPPLQPETDYPAMPLVSSLPGTTASPIRVPFGNSKGELVDLPGLSRGGLEHHVQEPYRPLLVMRSRVQPEQQVIKPGQSLLLGGFIRITPTTPDTIVLAYAFTPISSHLTSTEKAIGIQTQERESGVLNIASPGVGEKISSAGTFFLKYDVTKQRSGPITARSAAGIKVDMLPYRVLSTDILIEGCGWVELVVQVRKKAFEQTYRSSRFTDDVQLQERTFADPQWPRVEVFSPEGRFIATRKPLGAWVACGEKKPAVRMKGRPRQSMKGAKKKTKALKRISESHRI